MVDRHDCGRCQTRGHRRLEDDAGLAGVHSLRRSSGRSRPRDDDSDHDGGGGVGGGDDDVIVASLMRSKFRLPRLPVLRRRLAPTHGARESGIQPPTAESPSARMKKNKT